MRGILSFLGLVVQFDYGMLGVMLETEKERQLLTEGLRDWFKRENKELALFDMDSTLVDTTPFFLTRMKKFSDWVAKETGEDESQVFLTMKQYIRDPLLRQTYGVDPVIMVLTASSLVKTYGLDGQSKEYEQRLNELMKIYIESPEVFDKACEQIRIIADTGVRRGIVTHASEEWTRAKMQTHFSGLFEKAYCVPVGEFKDIWHWQMALEDFGVLPEQVLVVGDGLETDIKPALALGVNKMIWLNNREGTETINDNRVKQIKEIGELVEGIMSW